MYALYLRKRWVAIFLSSLLVVELLVAVVGAVITLHDDSFMLVDILGHLPTSFVYFGYVAPFCIEVFVITIPQEYPV